MEFYYITSVEDLEKGTFGVMEPIIAQCEKVTDFSTVFVVPGLSFDAKGYRLGYGRATRSVFIGFPRLYCRDLLCQLYSMEFASWLL